MNRPRPQRLSREQIWRLTFVALSIFSCGMICSLAMLYAARQTSSDATSYIDLGIEQYKAGNYRDSLDALNIAEKRDPDVPDIYYWRGQAHAALDNHPAAVADFSHTLELTSIYIDAYYLRGVSYEALDNPEAALRDYTEYLNLGGDDPEAVSRFNELSEAGDE